MGEEEGRGVNSLPDDQLDQTEEEHLADVVMGGSNLRGHRRLGYHRSHHPHLEGDDNMFDDVNSNHTHDEYHRNPSPSTPGLRRSRHRHGGLGSGVPLPESPSLVQHPLPSVPTFSQQRRPKLAMAAAAVLSATTGQAQQSYTGRPNAEQPVSVLTTASSTGMVPDRHSDSRSITGSLPNVSILNEINIESTKQQQQQQQFHQDMIKVDALANMGLLTNVDVNSSNSAYFS